MNDNPQHYLVGSFSNMNMDKCQDWMNANYAKGWVLKECHAVAGYGGPHSACASLLYVVLEWQGFEEEK